MPGLAARQREKGLASPEVRAGQPHHQAACHWVPAVSSGFWLLGLGGHPFSASQSRDLGLWWAFRLGENFLGPGKRTPFYIH